MILAQFLRKNYTTGVTPIEKLTKFSQAIDGPQIYIKRDDLLGLTGGGNKTRKLEFLMADAIAKGTDTIITAGALQSNHCRLTLAAAIKEGLACHLVLEEGKEQKFDLKASGNQLLFTLLKPEGVHIVSYAEDVMKKAEEVAVKLREHGRNPYIIPVGGSNEIGVLGYIRCAEEIIQQSNEMNLVFKDVFVASGSAGTQAGLNLGFYRQHATCSVKGICISEKKDIQLPKVTKLYERTAAFLQMDALEVSGIECYDEYLGEGYTVPTNGMIEAVKLLASTEGILLDPVYSGKAMAGLIDFVRQGNYDRNDNILFIHTGGAPSLPAYQHIFQTNIN